MKIRDLRHFVGYCLIVLLLTSLSGCGYNTLQRGDEEISAAWSEVVNQYQRRADLVPNLVNTVKGYAEHEKEVLEGVTEARAKATAIQLNATNLDPTTLKNYQEAQAGVTSALSRLIAIAENYPQLKADQNFRDLQAQLEGTENRVTVARKRYIDQVKEYNITVRSFPSNLTAKLFGFTSKPNFTVENEQAISVAPKVDFGSGK
jgi:LemA protein